MIKLIYEHLLQEICNIVNKSFESNQPVTADTLLSDLPAYDSLSVVGLIGDIEEVLGNAVPPEVLVPETFRTPKTIADVLYTIQLRSVQK
ncbi:acyl carrier protein [Paenibacillus pinisoli]|uniref:acyl carrier protein n=1 Tax=Paenibacillus pinisoli TaxID=1276110 RepID=UPI001402F72C|nr:acyl carrier protein [Paenibacillus pinisoli]